MIELVLQRISERQHATYGLLMENAEPWLNVLEDPWNNNIPFKSCIPPGSYTCRRVKSPKYGETFEVFGVPDRTLIRFHWGDDAEDTEGCILLGLQWGKHKEHVELDLSKAAFDAFMKRMNGIDSFRLYVRRSNASL